jgi:hypothetical protein
LPYFYRYIKAWADGFPETVLSVEVAGTGFGVVGAQENGVTGPFLRDAARLFDAASPSTLALLIGD